MSNNNLLNNQNIIGLSDYQQLKLAESYKELYSKSIDENKKEIKIKDDNKIYNISLKTLGINFFTTWTNILNKLIKLINNKNKNTFSDYMKIIVKNDRLIYVGIMFVLISLLIFFVSSTS